VVLLRGGGCRCRRGTDAGRALCFVRNSQSSRVKMSLVTAAMEKRARRALQRASMRAVLPEPTGLEALVALFFLSFALTYREETSIPSNADSESPVLPVAALDDWHFAAYEAPRAVQDLVRVAMVGGCVRVRVRGAVM
jgi:hypothetical protein